MRTSSDVTPAGIPLDDIDLYGPGLYANGDPHALWARLRTDAPWHRQCGPDGTPFWSVTRYHDVLAILKDADTFTSEHSTMLSAMDGDVARGRAINLVDGPGHTALRAPTMRRLSTIAMSAAAGTVGPRMRALVDGVCGAGPVDLARVWARLPMLIGADIIGLPEEHWDQLVRWTMASVAPGDPTLAADGDTLRMAHVELLMIFSDLIAFRRKHPGDDMISVLVGLERDGVELTDEDVMVNTYAFTMGANITTAQVAYHLALLIAERPGIWERIRRAEVSDAAILDEALRWATPTNHLLRKTTRAVHIAGRELAPGTLVCAWVASANRDEDVFTDPYRFDPDRAPNPHLGFGYGRHYCVGAHAARLGLTMLIAALRDRVAGIELTGAVRHLASNFVNGVTALPVRIAAN